MFDALQTQGDVERVAQVGPGVEPADVEDVKRGARAAAQFGPVPGSGLVALVPAQAEGAIAAASGADGERARPAADVEQPLAVGGYGQSAREPAPAVQHEGVAVDERRREAEEADEQ